MFNPTEIPKQFKVFSIEPDLRISFAGQIWSKMFVSILLLPFVALFVGHFIFVCLGSYEILHLNLEKAIDFFSYGTNNFWYFLMFVFTSSLLSVATWYWFWIIFGFCEIRATEESLTTIYKMLGMSWKKSVLTKEIRYFNQFLKRDGEGDTWNLEIVTNQKLFDEEQSYPSWFPQKWVSADMLVRMNYKTVHLYSHSSPRSTEWLGKTLARFYQVEFKSTAQPNVTSF
ncbi:MAG: hypothetical protein AAF349_24405 [Cyanobacteria bacterium P01_A01_bin.68]